PLLHVAQHAPRRPCRTGAPGREPAGANVPGTARRPSDPALDGVLTAYYLSTKITLALFWRQGVFAAAKLQAAILLPYISALRHGGIMSTNAAGTVPAGTGQSTWTIDPDHTQVWFSVKHMMFATVKGQFPGVSGQLVLNERDPAQSRVEVQLDAATIDTHNEQRDKHLRSADFFDADNHPQLTFVSRVLEPRGGSKYRVTGDLTIRGTTREVVLDA